MSQPEKPRPEGRGDVTQIAKARKLSGRKIIAGLKDAVRGNLSRVVVDGQIWVSTGAALSNITRVEVIEKGNGRVYVRYEVESLELSEQDEGRTLKVFVESREKVRSRWSITKPLTGTWTKRDDKTAKFMDVKADPKPFRGVRKGKGVVSRPR